MGSNGRGYDVADPALAKQGLNRVDWADQNMPVLRQIRDEFASTRPLKGLTVGACLHVTGETANLMRALKAAGAKVLLCASNPLSTQDDSAAALVKEGIPVFAIHGEDHKTYYNHLRAVLDARPDVTLDDGADLAICGEVDNVQVVHSGVALGGADGEPAAVEAGAVECGGERRPAQDHGGGREARDTGAHGEESPRGGGQQEGGDHSEDAPRL